MLKTSQLIALTKWFNSAVLPSILIKVTYILLTKVSSKSIMLLLTLPRKEEKHIKKNLKKTSLHLSIHQREFENVVIKLTLRRYRFAEKRFRKTLDSKEYDPFHNQLHDYKCVPISKNVHGKTYTWHKPWSVKGQLNQHLLSISLHTARQ